VTRGNASSEVYQSCRADWYLTCRSEIWYHRQASPEAYNRTKWCEDGSFDQSRSRLGPQENNGNGMFVKNWVATKPWLAAICEVSFKPAASLRLWYCSYTIGEAFAWRSLNRSYARFGSTWRLAFCTYKCLQTRNSRSTLPLVPLGSIDAQCSHPPRKLNASFSHAAMCFFLTEIYFV
jgi:hypothetical protein